MPEPTFPDLLDEELAMGDQNESWIANKATQARVSAAYWRGLAEGLERAIDAMKASHDREIEQLVEGHEFTLSYLKDRLNRLEAGPRTA